MRSALNHSRQNQVQAGRILIASRAPRVVEKPARLGARMPPWFTIESSKTKVNVAIGFCLLEGDTLTKKVDVAPWSKKDLDCSSGASTTGYVYVRLDRSGPTWYAPAYATSMPADSGYDEYFKIAEITKDSSGNISAIQNVRHDVLVSAPEKGLILMWSGLIANIPVGWVLCDATNASTYGCPDLSGRFIVSYGQNASPQTNDSNPNYSIGPGGTGDGWNDHGYSTGLTVDVNNHDDHDPLNYDPGAIDPHTDTEVVCVDTTEWDDQIYTWKSTPDLSHNTLDTITNWIPSAHSMTDNRPPYYALAFIFKL
jgi:hypothetical protein